MNPLKCVFGMSAGWFLGFVVHEKGIEIDPKKIESIKRLGPPECKCDVQKLLGKINYLRGFIANLAGKVDSFLPLLRLKHEQDFTWGTEQEATFNKINEYLVSPPVLRAPVSGQGFRLYSAAQEKVIGAALTQEDGGKEFVLAYMSRRQLDAETRYVFLEKLCLALYYACSKFHHYLLSSSCTIICSHDIIKCVLQKPILSGRLGKWAYALTEYELEYKTLSAVKGQVLADFMVEHGMEEAEVCTVEEDVWKLWFDGSVCSHGQGVRCFVMSPSSTTYELCIRLDFRCTNNQVKYEALLSGLEVLAEMGVQRVEIFGDAKLVIQQINGESQCLDGILNEYKEECVKALANFEKARVQHVPRKDNEMANALAQQASGYQIRRAKFGVRPRPMIGTVLAIQSGAEDNGRGEVAPEDWRRVLIEYILEPGRLKDRKNQLQGTRW
jgi:ribonuclease HI